MAPESSNDIGSLPIDDPGLKETLQRETSSRHPGNDESVAQTALTASDSPQDEEASSWKRKEMMDEFEVALKTEETSSSFRGDSSTVDIHVITDTIFAGTRKRPRALVNYLNELYQEGPRLFVDLSDEPPSVSVLEAFDYQLIHLPWSNSHSPVPSIAKALEFCYVISAWDRQCVILCENGKRKTAPMVAAILKFTNKTNRCYEGFCHFLERRCSIPKPDEIQLPASLYTFFENFDTIVNIGKCPNRRPLKLDTITLQGVPVEDRPCIDIWDTTGHIYTSNDSTDNVWIDEEGFYSLQIKVLGDFCLICRFGGAYASDTDDASKVLFQYCNTTAFMQASGQYELPATHVDLSQRYASQLVENFLLTVTFDEDFGGTNSDYETDQCGDAVPIVVKGSEARETGWQLISSKHPLNPSDADIDKVLGEAMGELDSCPRNVVALSLQLTNFDSTMALTLLLEGWLRSWWQNDTPAEIVDQETIQESAIDPFVELESPEAKEKIKSILESIGTLHDRSGLDPATSNVRSKHFDFSYPNSLMKPLPGDVATSKITSFRLSSILNEPSLLLDEQPAAPFLLKYVRAHTPNVLENIENDHAFEILEGVENTGVPLSDLLALSEVTDCEAQLQVASLEASSPGPPQSGAVLFGDETPETQTNLAQDLSLNQTKSTSSQGLLANERLTGTKALAVESNPSRSSAVAISSGTILSDSSFGKQIPGVDDETLGIRSKEAADARLVPKPQVDDLRYGDPPCEDLQRDGHHLVVPVQEAAGPHTKKSDGSESAATGIAGLAAAAARKKQSDVSESAATGIAGLAAAAALKKQAGIAAAASKKQSDVSESVAASSLQQQLDTSAITVPSPDCPLKEDPKYEKYFKMLKMGLPRGAVENAMQRDQVDYFVLDLDPERSLACQTDHEQNLQCDDPPLKSQTDHEQNLQCDDPPLKSDPKFTKYFKMLKMGLPRGAVLNAMQRDGVDEAIIDLDPEKSLKAQRSETDEGLPLRDDPAFQKYFKMLKMGLPDGAVRNAMQRDGVDSSILDLDHSKSVKSQMKPIEKEDDGVAIKDDPTFAKYFKMMKMGLPDGAVQNAMQRDGVDPSILDLDHNRSLKSQTGSDENDDVPIKDDPAFLKYFKMLKMGLPMGAVRNAMERDGVDSTVLDLDHEKSLQSQQASDPVDDGVPLKDDPEWSKYFKMLKMGLPMGAVKNAVERDGKDPSVMDLDHSKSIASQTRAATKRGFAAKKKKRVRRKKIFWNPLDSRQIKEGSIWSRVKGTFQMSKLSYDEKEFAELFTESTDPGDQKKKSKTKDATKPKKSVQVIDGKRSMNGGIILARLKMDYTKIADMVNHMKMGSFDSNTLKALKEMLPTAEERQGLMSYMKAFDKTEEDRQKGYADLSECEKYMYTMLDVSQAADKFDCLLFRSQFQGRIDELQESVEKVERACDEVHDSDKLQRMMGMILTLVNQINTGGDGNEAAGFTLDALPKLTEAKAFDKRTSVLHYFVKLLKRNDKSLLTVKDDLQNVKAAELVILDSLSGDIQALKEDIQPILETVTKQAEELAAAGELTAMTLKELSEQKTSVKAISHVKQYNQVEHHTGRTPMERFTLYADSRIDSGLSYCQAVKAKFTRLLDYFGEDPKKASNEFFGTLNKFLAEFQTAIEQVEKQEKAKKREEEKRAKAAARKSKLSPVQIKKGEEEGKSITVKRHGSGIAALAAAAAARKSVEGSDMSLVAASIPRNRLFSHTGSVASEDDDGASDGKDASLPSATSGIAPAGAAAAALRKHSTAPDGTDSPQSSPAGGIAAAAAAAALKKRSTASHGNDAPQSSLAGGIAAAAAAAALRKLPDTAKNSAATRHAHAGGIAAAAAAAALKKSSAASNGNDSPQSYPAGGIAAAAAAALKKRSTVSHGNDAPQSSHAGGIAAAAADAALKKAFKSTPAASLKNQSDLLNERECGETSVITLKHVSKVDEVTTHNETELDTGQYKLPQKQTSATSIWMNEISKKVMKVASSEDIDNAEEDYRVGAKEESKVEVQSEWLASIAGSITKVPSGDGTAATTT